MGVHLLKTFLAKQRLPGIYKTGLNHIANKTIVVDVSIYIYKFKMNERLVSDLKKLCKLLKYYNINALFVFDGTNKHASKTKTIQDRNNSKTKFLEEYNRLKVEIKSETNNSKNIYMLGKMNTLKKRFVRIDKNDIIITKNILDAFGLKYVTANGEADELCATLVYNKKAWACLTEDTDLFIYKCPVVINYLNIENGTMVIHDLYKIINHLNMNFEEFI